MDSRSTAAESPISFPQPPWSHSPTVGPTTPTANGPRSQADCSPGPLSNGLEYFHLPIHQAQAKLYHQQQLLHYGKLIAPGRGGGQPQQLGQIPSSSHIHSTPRSRSASKVSNKDHPSGKGTQGGHGNKPAQNTDRAHRPVTTTKDAPQKMAPKKAESSHPLSARPPPPPPNPSQSHSSSVPSTPLQHARNFSFESRDPSPNATNSHSPRSAYSETTAQIPPLRQLPPKLGHGNGGGCPFENAQMHSKRRIPYSIGHDKLEPVDTSKIKSKLSEDDERKLTTDMRELYDRLLPTSKVESNRQKLVNKLETIFNDEWPGHNIRVHLFGSSGNLLCSDDSDVDICITTEWKDMEAVCMIAGLLAKRGMEKVVCISAAKVPIVKMWDPELRLACDMNVNNTLALENTRMVRTYIEIDDRVRPLAMIIKYWTRRRIINDAAFGGTLSSYTWICLIIAFLQLRDPPIVPALHQRPNHQRLPKKNGVQSEFADDLNKLRGFGKKNKSTLGELLFEFFRFYAYEFDYDKHSLSVRHGRIMTKKEKNWQHALNNRLCMEEPFNTSRNLGNTADDYSFKGLQQELRRAFDLVAEGNLEECCEQFVFPKEEERVFTQPPRNPQPVLIRSASQTHSSRGGRGGYGRSNRHNYNYRNGNSSRRASSSLPYEPNNNVVYTQPFPSQDLQWYMPTPYTPEMMLHLFTQNQLLAAQAFQQSQSQQQQSQGQQRGTGKTAPSQTGSDRSRTNSFDNPPLSAPLRPEIFSLYPVAIQRGASAYFQAPAAPGFGTYPNTPSTSNGAAAEFRRGLHRSSAAAEAGNSAAGSSLRSQSQPASRTMSSAQANSGFASAGAGSGLASSSSSGFIPRNNANGVRIPSFMADETEYEESPKAQPLADSSPSEETPYLQYSLSESSSPQRRANPPLNGLAFGDLQQPPQDRRRLSTELPQSILDHRMRRVSRSPSPHGHARAFSAGTSSAPLASAPFPPSNNAKSLGRPLVANGSMPKSMSNANRQQTESLASEDSNNTPVYENPLHIGRAHSFVPGQEQHPLPSMNSERSPQSLAEQAPVIVNGSNHANHVNQSLPSGTTAAAAPAALASAALMQPFEEPSFRERLERNSMMNQSYFVQAPMYQADPTFNAAMSPTTRQRLRQQQGGVIGPLDLAIDDYKMGAVPPVNTDLQHLSPVYEGKAPSPTTFRKFDTPTKKEKAPQRMSAKNAADASSSGHKVAEGSGYPAPETKQWQSGSRPSQPKGQATPKSGLQANQLPKAQLPPRPPPSEVPETNGDHRLHKHETTNGEGTWQKAGKHRRKGNDSRNHVNGQTQGEAPPKHESDRKGG